MTDNELLALVDRRIQQFDGRLEQMVEQGVSTATAVLDMTTALVKLVETRAVLRTKMDD